MKKVQFLTCGGGFVAIVGILGFWAYGINGNQNYSSTSLVVGGIGAVSFLIGVGLDYLRKKNYQETFLAC